MNTTRQGGWVETLEPRELFSATGGPPFATFMQYVKAEGDSRTFAVLYQGPADIDRATISGNDIIVTGSNEFQAFAKPVGIAHSKPGQPTLVRYRVEGIPGQGLYTINVRPYAVADIEQSFVSFAAIG